MYIRSYYDTFKSICVIHGYIFGRLLFSVAKARGRRVNQHLHLRGDRRLFFTVARAVAADAPALVDAALTVAR